MSQWYYIDASGAQQATDEGTLTQMYRAGQINDDTFVWSESLGGDWASIGSQPSLVAKLKPPAATTMPPRAAPGAAGGIGAQIGAQAAQNKKLGPVNSNSLGAPAPVSSGVDTRQLNIVKRQEPSHGWKVCSVKPLCFFVLVFVFHQL